MHGERMQKGTEHWHKMHIPTPNTETPQQQRTNEVYTTEIIADVKQYLGNSLT